MVARAIQCLPFSCFGSHILRFVSPFRRLIPDFFRFVILFRNPNCKLVLMARSVQWKASMSRRVRHCVECPNCHTSYLVAFSPYRNGAYLVRTSSSAFEEYTLYCFCQGHPPPSISKWRQAKACQVSKPAHDRGFGTLDEIWPIACPPVVV